MKNNLLLIKNSLAKPNSVPSSIKNQSINYSFQKWNKDEQYIKSASIVLENFFTSLSCLISKPVFIFTSNKVVIYLFYYSTYKTADSYNFNQLTLILAKIFKKDVELELVKLHYPYHNSDILAKFIALNGKKYNFIRIRKNIFNKVDIAKGNQLPSKLSGIKIKLSGRLTTERMRPRATVQTAEKGSFIKGKNSLVHSSKYTSKNKMGSFTVKVWLSHLLNS
jgi:hypothetical protein